MRVFWNLITVGSFKSQAWYLSLTGALLVMTYLVGSTRLFAGFEYQLFEFIVKLQPSGRLNPVPIELVRLPDWALMLIYLPIYAFYVHKYTRSKTTAVSFFSLSIILFLLLMLEILLALFGGLFLPIILPVLLMLLVSTGHLLVEMSQHFRALHLLDKSSVSLEDTRQRIENGELKRALILLKQCPMNDDLLEVGYELGMLLESKNHWAGALNLYHWLAQYDPGLGDFVTRVEEIRDNRAPPTRNMEEDEELKKIGHYKIVKKIARGSTANVYDGYDLRTHNRVALKIMSSRLDEDAESDRIQNWLREAEIVSRLEHRNIAKIHDAAVEGETPYIAMDYISGHSMAYRLRKREYITVGESIRICKAVLSALAVAHKHGVVHGDIKPANIMYDDNKRTYIITDFGAAYTDKNKHQNDEYIVGTPAYMSPEQLEGKKLDGRSDLFSLAVTLYHLLTGHLPFSGDNLPELKRSIIREEPDLDHLTLPAGIMEVIIKALEKKTYMRFADAQQMLVAVEYCEAQMRERMQRQ